MKMFIKILRGSVPFIYLILLSCVLSQNAYYAEVLNMPILLIPIIATISIIIIGFNYIKLYLKVNVIEYEFISIANHTFRTPLTKMVWALKELKELEFSKEKLVYLKNIENSANRILDIVDILIGMQDVKNTSSYAFKPILIRKIVEDAIAKYTSRLDANNIKTTIDGFKDIPPLTADLKKITFVFDALVENAIYYNKNGGQIQIGAINKGDKILFYIADSGMGITFFERMRMFKKFYRSKRARSINTDGMGLSLYLIRLILKKHGGKIYFKTSGKDKGCTFFIELLRDKNSGEIR